MPAHQVADEADNHINMKSLDGDPAGQIFAAVKTSLNHPNDPIYYLLVLQNDNTWRSYPLARVTDDWTRATVLIDKESRRIYAFGASPCCNGGVIYYKVSSLDNISFPVGQGTPLMQSSTDPHINNPTSTKQALTSATGLLAIAGDDSTHRYAHNSFGLGSGDAAPPDTSIDTGPPTTSYASSVAFGFSSSEAGATFSCSLDGAAFNTCTSPTSYAGLADGSHSFQIRATDFSGNTDPTPASRTWTIDTSNPTVTVASDADAEVNSATPDTNLGTATTMAVDSSPSSEEAYLRFPVTGTTGTRLDAKLRVFASDGTLDGPAVYGASNTWSETGITWSNRPARTSAALEDRAGVTSGTWVEYDVTSAVTGNGTYTFNLGSTSADATRLNSREATTNKPQLALIVRSDTTAPETTIDAGSGGRVGSGSASFGFSSTESGSTFRCSLDGSAYAPCTSPQTYAGLADGSHTFAVCAVNWAGSADASPATRTWTVDTAAPAAPVIVSPADGSVNGTGTVAVSGTAEPLSTVAVFDGTSQQGTSVADAGGSWSVTLTGVGNGSHTYTTRATDAAGNTSAASAGVTLAVDSTAPNTGIDSGPSGTVDSRSGIFAFSSDKAGSTFRCSLDGAGYEACTSPKAYSGLAEGGHSFAVYATDPLGHVDPTPASRTWTIDLTIVSDDFESGGFRALLWVVRTGADGTAAVQPGVGRNGSYGARLSETTAIGSLGYARASFGSRTELTVAGDLDVLAEGAGGGNVPLLRLFDAPGTRLVSLYRQNLAQDKLYVQHGGSSVLTSGRLALNTWAHVELHVITAGAGTSTVDVRVNGAVVYSTTSASLGTSGIQTAQIGNETAKQAFALIADNIMVTVPG